MAAHLVKRFLKQFRTNIITGVLLFIPMFVTIIIMIKLFQWVDSVLPGIIGVDWAPGLGVLVTLTIAYFAGLTAKNYFGKKLIATGNSVISNIPFLNKIYLTIQQIVDTVTLNKKRLFERAVLIEFPKENCFSIGFVTCNSNADFSEKTGHKLISVFVPTTPNPTSGYLLYFPEEEIIDLKIPVEMAIKLVMSGGIISADRVVRMPGALASPLKKWNWHGIFKNSHTGQTDPRD